jgi:SAM-dependent methyltransferase
MANDRFSKLASEYAQYRPAYPPRLAEYLASLTKRHQLAWDCATGNGQAAVSLTHFYQRVLATDVSTGQIAHAHHNATLNYAVAAAEHTPIIAKSVDLIAVGQAIQWFDLDQFYLEAERVLKADGILAAWGYSQPEISPDIDPLLARYYDQILGPYLPPQLELVEQRYRTLPFPFYEIAPPELSMDTTWTFQQLLGMMSSMSPVVAYQAEHGKHPVEEIYDALSAAWGLPEKPRRVHWPLFFRIGSKGIGIT